MALYNEILAGRYNRFLQKLMQLKGQAPAPQLASEITPAFDVEDTPVELKILKGTALFAAAFNIPGVAAQTSTFQLRNPLGSGVLAVIEGLVVSAGVASQMSISQAYNNPANLTNVATGSRRDARSQSNSSATPSSGNNFADLAFGSFQFLLPVNTPFSVINEKNQEWPVLPGQCVRVNTITTNVLIIAGLLWRERPIEDSELTA
jgi:hypothetical protein